MLGLVGRGLTNAEIAERLVLSRLTAKTHVSRILTKLGLRDRSQLVIAAYESGLLGTGVRPVLSSTATPPAVARVTAAGRRGAAPRSDHRA